MDNQSVHCQGKFAVTRLLPRWAAERLRRLRRSKDGVTAMEYGIIAAAITVAIVSILNGISPVVGTLFSKISTSL